MTSQSKPTVFIIEDDNEVCEGLQWLLTSVNLDVEIYHTGFDYLKAYDPSRIGCLLIDVRLPEMSGLELQQQLLQRDNPIPIIMITGYGDVRLAVRAMKGGAKDFILKPFNNDILLEQIQNAIKENREYHEVKYRAVNHFASLTSREKEVMQLIIEGKLNKQIAAKLDIAISTVEKHRASIMRKTRTKSVAELVKLYIVINNTEKESLQ